MNIKDNIANEFDAFSVNYTDDMMGCVPHYATLMAHFTKNLPATFKPSQILDLGCGNGNITASFIEQYPMAHYTLLDASKGMLHICERRFKNYNSVYINSYFQDFKFKSNYFDLVVAGFSLHHCNASQKKNIFKKIHQSLRSGGIFMCSDLMIHKNNVDHPKLKENWKNFVLQSFPDGKKWQWLMEHYDEFDKPDDLKDQLLWLSQAKFKTIDVKVYENYWGHFRAVKN